MAVAQGYFSRQLFAASPPRRGSPGVADDNAGAVVAGVRRQRVLRKTRAVSITNQARLERRDGGGRLLDPEHRPAGAQ